jgi:hypothetical protein
MGGPEKLPPLWELIAMVSFLLSAQEALIWAWKEWRSRRK